MLFWTGVHVMATLLTLDWSCLLRSWYCLVRWNSNINGPNSGATRTSLWSCVPAWWIRAPLGYKVHFVLKDEFALSFCTPASCQDSGSVLSVSVWTFENVSKSLSCCLIVTQISSFVVFCYRENWNIWKIWGGEWICLSRVAWLDTW